MRIPSIVNLPGCLMNQYWDEKPGRLLRHHPGNLEGLLSDLQGFTDRPAKQRRSKIPGLLFSIADLLLCRKVTF